MPGFWDYGPLGCELKNNVKQAWSMRAVLSTIKMI